MCVLCPQDRAIATGADPSRVNDFPRRTLPVGAACSCSCGCSCVCLLQLRASVCYTCAYT